MQTIPNNLSEIAKIIRADWQKVHYTAAPYLSAMETLDSINDSFYEDSARSIVVYFLSNAHSWHGDTAKEVKQKLNELLKEPKQ
ncbi:hypothetical protein SAMN05444266_10279 [Chitinophaga jiangningensis]|uniref:Uncharacterized protein n=1 Tax=Chitinophaga jiangningensis TaxID=1419482 RepID=A0A1M6XYS2_9BACT|nr:hypothetical protein [Chitinophaga jiangningensis]SHL11151.1 hypothetical protein SAMN05444266_10279 [Chitinophaga jiangningensis]